MAEQQYEPFSQEGRTFRLETPLSGDEELFLEGFSGVEGVSRPFCFNLEVLSQSSTINPEDILRKQVSIKVGLQDSSDRIFNGVVSRFSQLGRSEGYTGYELEVVPQLWFLTLSSDCRIFQKMSSREILMEVFDSYDDLKYDLRGSGTNTRREYCVQYRETDLAFVSRLMEEEGIFYYFEHSDTGHILVLADHETVAKKCDPPKARFSPQDPLDEDVILGLEQEHVVHTTAVTLTDYDLKDPKLDLLSATPTKPDEVFDYPGKFSSLSDGEERAASLLREVSSRAKVLRGHGTCRPFMSGSTFQLEGYYRDDMNVDFLILAVEHSAHGGGYRSGNHEPRYNNQFECVPADVPFHPPTLTRKPLIRGSQTAVVVGPSNEEIFTNELGQVKVQFHWDRLGKKDDSSSCWIRVSQPWAGKNWGAIAIPRIGQEVIVGFIEGDPDRPIITGRVYNDEQTPPYKLPANKTQTGIKSRSSKGGGAATFNEIRMEDKKGAEVLYFHAEKDKAVIVENDNEEEIGNDEKISVGHDQELSIENDRTISVGDDHEEDIGSDMTLTIGSDREMEVGGSLDESVGGDMSVEVSGSGSTDIGSGLEVKVGKNAAVAVKKKGDAEFGDALSVAAKSVTINAKDEIALKVGTASITIKKTGDIEISGMNIKIQAKAGVDVKASTKIGMQAAQVAQN